jgi:ABC-2 type transport system ATP-binding protein
VIPARRVSSVLTLFSRSANLRERVGYVPELHFIYRWMTVHEVLCFASELYKHWDFALVACLLTKFALPENKRVSTLSKGMTAKLGLILALSHHPELLILDEPTSGLDPIIREDFLESVLHSQTENNKTVFFSSHHVDDVERVSDTVGIMVNGSLVIQGSPDELKQRIKRLRAVLKDGKLPKRPPTEMIHQSLSPPSRVPNPRHTA